MSTRTMLLRLACGLSAALALAPCSSRSAGGGGGSGYGSGDALGDGSGGTGGGDGGGWACSPGDTQACLCPPDLKGVQICKPEGTAWGPCDCGLGPGDGGSTGGDSGGQGSGDAGDLGGSDPGSVEAGGGGDSGGSTGDGGTPEDECIERARDVYLVTAERFFLRFEPTFLKITVLGKLACPVDATFEPFSMSVDRNADAWVLYRPSMTGSGKLFKVSTIDASCQATSFVPGQQGMDLFGMGFASDVSGSKKETLYVAGGKYDKWETSQGVLAAITFPDLKVVPLAVIDIGPGSPELTGTGLGELYGFFPSAIPPSVRQIDKVTGKTGKSYTLPSAAIKNTQAWAFAHWSGNFYLFFKSVSDPSSGVWRVNGVSSAVDKVIDKTGYTIVGAGVSSCAPTE
jgi:hypothetical protein